MGYSVALPGPASGSQRAIWFGGGRLARDLTLPSLREGWQQSAGEQENAVKEWSRWTSSAPRTRDERRAELEHRAVRWHQCVSDVDRLRRQLRRVDGDPAGTARVARDAAGILAAWSVALEADEPGSLARASRHWHDLRSCAPLTACLHRAPEHAARRSRYSFSRARGRTAPQAWFVLARQLSLLGRDLAHLHQLRGEVDRARELETEFASQLRDLHEHLESQSTRPPADPQATVAIEPVLRPLPPFRPGAPDAQQEAAAARRVIDATQDRRPPRGR